MLESPEVRYVQNAGVSLAYQLVGQGPVDVLEMSGFVTHLEVKWEDPLLVRSIEGLTRFARVILFDPRGMGWSDRMVADTDASLDELVGDARAVLDAAGSRETVLLGIVDGAGIAAAFAAAHPERTRALVLYNTVPLVAGTNPLGVEFDSVIAAIEREWGTGVMATIMGAEEMRAHFARVERRTCTPHAAAAMIKARMQRNLEAVLPTIRVPTLIIHYRDHPTLPIEGAREVAAAIPGARLVELTDYSATVQVRERAGLAPAVEEFVTGSTSVGDDDRILAAILFTDIVASTERATELGDRRWRDLLDEHDRRVRRAIEAATGVLVKTTGDGVLARFDGAARAVRCAQALVEEGKRLGVAVRAGIHVGECEKRGEDIGGIAVHVAARVMGLAGPHEVYATSTVRESLLGTDVEFSPRGVRTLRGVPEAWNVFVVS